MVPYSPPICVNQHSVGRGNGGKSSHHSLLSSKWMQFNQRSASYLQRGEYKPTQDDSNRRMLAMKASAYGSKCHTAPHCQYRMFDLYFRQVDELTALHCTARPQYPIPVLWWTRLDWTRDNWHLTYLWWWKHWIRWQNSIWIFLADFRYQQRAHPGASSTAQRMS